MSKMIVLLTAGNCKWQIKTSYIHPFIHSNNDFRWKCQLVRLKVMWDKSTGSVSNTLFGFFFSYHSIIDLNLPLNPVYCNTNFWNPKQAKWSGDLSIIMITTANVSELSSHSLFPPSSPICLTNFLFPSTQKVQTLQKKKTLVLCDIKGSQPCYSFAVRVLPCLIGKLDLDLRGEYNAVKGVMKSQL